MDRDTRLMLADAYKALTVAISGFEDVPCLDMNLTGDDEADELLQDLESRTDNLYQQIRKLKEDVAMLMERE